MHETKGPPRLRWTVALAVIGLVSTTHAIVIRHDREDADYVRRAAEYEEIVGVGRAHGTLIAPDWVLTAAHVVDGGLSPVSGSVRVGDRDHAIKRVVLHPTWVGDLGPGLAHPDWIDMALVELAEPVRDATPARLYAGSDEVGREIVFVGRGKTGDGLTGPTRSDGVKRAATNRVDRADDAWLYFEFDRPPAGTELEGISGPGDSGNAALLDVDGIRYVLGVGSRNDHRERELAECVYGTTEVYARVSAQIDWIRETLESRVGPGVPVPVDGERPLPDSPAGRTARAFFELYNAGDEEALTVFASERLSDERKRILPPADWARVWSRQRKKSGPVAPAYAIVLRENKLVVVASARDHWKSYRFELEGNPPHRLRQLEVSRERMLAGRPLPEENERP